MKFWRSGGVRGTIRRDCLELWQGLVLQDMGEVDFHVFWKYWKLTSSPIPTAKKGHKTNTNRDKLETRVFHKKLFFSQFLLKLGSSRGVRGDGMEHTKTLSRTLAGFGLTWHRKVNFSTFGGKLEGSFMTKYNKFAV